MLIFNELIFFGYFCDTKNDRMKKLIYLLMLMPVLAFSQKLTTKKDKILSDKKEVAMLTQSGRDEYVFSTLDGKKQFSTKYNALSESDAVMYQWLTVTSADGQRQSEIPYEVLMTSFSPSKIVLRLLSEKYGLIDDNGINQQKLDEFFNTKRENLSEKYLKTVVIAKEEAKEKQKDYAAKVGAVRPFVKNDGVIVSGGSLGTKIIGRVVPITYTFKGNNSPIIVYDLDGVAARAELVDNVENDVNVTMFDDNKFTYRAKRRYTNTDNNLFLTQLIEELVARDYTLGHQAKINNSRLRQEKIAKAKERSANLYNVKGYAIDNKSQKYDGVLTAQFEMLDIDQTGNNQVTDAIDNYGKKVSVKYLNEKGRERTTTLNASDGTKFCIVNADGTETCFIGMKVKGDAMKKISNAMSLGFNNAYFYELVYEAKGNMVLKDPVEADIYVIKTKDKKEGQMIDNRNNTRLSTELAEYLGSCKGLANEIKTGVFDLKVEENLIKIVDEFNVCK